MSCVLETMLVCKTPMCTVPARCPVNRGRPSIFEGFSEPIYKRLCGTRHLRVISITEYDLPIDDLPSNKNGMSYLISCFTSLMVLSPLKIVCAILEVELKEMVFYSRERNLGISHPLP